MKTSIKTYNYVFNTDFAEFWDKKENIKKQGVGRNALQDRLVQIDAGRMFPHKVYSNCQRKMKCLG